MNVYGSTLASGGGGGTSDYSDLNNKPQIEGVTLSGNKTASDLGLAKVNDIPTVPTKVSQLQNDSGFITNSALPGVYAGDTAGLVPAAGSDNEGKYLDNDGNWTDPLEDFVQIHGGKVLLDIPSNTYSTYIEAFDAICDILANYSMEQITSMVILYGSYYYRISTASIVNGLYTIVSHRYNESNAPNADSMRVGQFSKGAGVTFGKWILGAANNQVTYSLGEYKTAAQATRIALVDTSVSATMIGKINRSDIYDTTEKVVGKWTDGRPLYQKVIATTMPNCTTDGTEIGSLVSIGANVENVAFSHVFIKNSNGIILPLYMGIPAVDVKYARYNICLNNASDTSTKNTVKIMNANTGWNGKDVIIILQYTKTTDAANSYNYADENDYSTSEKIIGKWIDGKTLYQKTLTGSWTINASNNSIVAPGGASNIDTLVNGGGTGYDFNNGSKSQRVLNSYMGFVFREGNDIGIQSTYKMVWTSVTIQYTKTTD